MEKLPVYECKIQDQDESGIYAVSFVGLPAIERNFVALKKAQRSKIALNSQKQVLTGAVLVPDQLIYRNSPELGEYYIKFTAQDIEKIARKMMKTGLALSTTTHQHEEPLQNNYLTEIWIVEDPKRDKSVALGLNELPKGSLVASYKIEDAKYWRNEVLSGNVKGFSLEGIFNFNSVTMSKKTKTVAQLNKEAATKKSKGVPAFLRSMAALLEGDTEGATVEIVDEAKKDETDSGDPYIIFDLANGGEIWVDEEGYCTLDGEQMAPGEHELADGNFIVVDDSGTLVVTQPEADGAEPDEAKVEAAKQLGKQFLGKFNSKEAKIAQLEKELKELKGKPSTKKVVASVEGAAAKEIKDMTSTELMAAAIRSRQGRKK